MKTVMQEILEKCQDESITFQALGKWVQASAYILLEKERQQIDDSYVNGMHKGNEIAYSDEKIKLDVNYIDYSLRLAEQYYNETYLLQTRQLNKHSVVFITHLMFAMWP